ncbi:hypothetical protein [Glutamicibacter sp.]|uniref:hypothetical protein n=1 Tax=Glutamicibacter sp. TaxID=1931995 RepID=UPI0028BED31B|nr:hypothetical protein [Glutamicibacter sp.]
MEFFALGGLELTVLVLWLLGVLCESIAFARSPGKAAAVKLFLVIVLPLVGTVIGLATGVRLILAARRQRTNNS